MRYELCEYKPIREFGYGWVAILEFDSKEEADKAKLAKENPNNFMVREKREIPKSSYRGANPNLSATKRRELFNSTDPKEFRKIM